MTADNTPPFKPKIGDLVTNTHIRSNELYRSCTGILRCFINQGRDAYIGNFCEEVSALKIIQRNGKPFHCPEVEV